MVATAALLLFCLAGGCLVPAAGFRAPQSAAVRTEPPTPPHLHLSKWAEDIDESVEKLESAKIALVSLLGGAVISTPLGLLLGQVQSFDASWQIQHVALPLSLLLFGITYRYAVRADGNPQLKQGVVGAFAITRALCLVRVPEGACLGTGGGVGAGLTLLDCGAPFHVFTWGILSLGLLQLLESFSAYGGLAALLEGLFQAGLLRRFPSTDGSGGGSGGDSGAES
ncbi:hypothetical protein B484DRAFT_428627 [Ochromonadaceae sp. CCMP2298]|nr:hypothetical protein B484DRAFT_428627 [Ochromonadaceae sp. CCMP2298]